MKPKRIQQSRKKGWRKPEGAISVTRSTFWGNPFKVGETVTPQHEGWGAVSPKHAEWVPSFGWEDIEVPDAATAVALYRTWLEHSTAGHYISQVHAKRKLRGHDLMCWCPLVDEDGNPYPCHATVLLEIANGGSADADATGSDG